ncbi:unnamed protein product [Scytosiphon promiscuus]
MAFSVTKAADALPRSVSLAAVGFDVEGSSQRNPAGRTFSAREDDGTGTAEVDRTKVTQKRSPFRPSVVGFAAFFVRNNKSFQAVTATSNEEAPSTFDDESTNRKLSHIRWH